MTLKRIISILLACVLICAMFTTNVFAATNGTYNHVTKIHEYKENNTVDCYSFSGYSQIDDAFAYAFLTSMTNQSVHLEAVAMVDVIYTDGSYDCSPLASDEGDVNGANSGVIAYAEVYYNDSKIVDSFAFYHFYYVNGTNVHNRYDTAEYGFYND